MAKEMSESKKLNLSRIDMYRKFAGKTEAEVIQYLLSKPIHCVKCKTPIVTIDSFVAPINNSLAIQLKKADGTNLNGVPAVRCSCGYDNTVFKLMYQVMRQYHGMSIC